MFRFSIRELLLITVIGAMSVSMALREQQWRADAEAIRGQRNVLEFFLVQARFVVDWDEDRTMVTIFRRDDTKSGRALFAPAFNAHVNPWRHSLSAAPPDNAGKIERRHDSP